MDKKECLNLIEKYFEIKSYINNFKNPGFELKSHTFYYRDIFKEVDEIRILRVASKNKEENIVFDIYYVSKAFEGLFHGYFRIQPESDAAKKIFENISKVCTDLGYYFYYAYQHSDLLKKYMISGNLKSVLEQRKDIDFYNLYDEIKKDSYMEIAQYKTKELQNLFLRREHLQKYVANFIKFNGKCSEEVKMFLINILCTQYRDYICLINRTDRFKNFIKIDTKAVCLNNHSQIPVHGLMDYAVQNNFILFLRLEFDFEGGDNVGKIAR